MTRLSRRSLLATLGAGVLAGCLDAAGFTGDELEDVEPEGGSGPPTADISLPLPDDPETMTGSIISGGVSIDGIPSIDDPVFMEASEANEWLEDGEPVFGVVVDDDVRAYPQRVLVWHEIVNDTVGDLDLAVTYCPLTGTAQAFERGETEFGVSGQLLNSNLIMYDRASLSYWPQMLATAIRGEFEGRVLNEYPVTWTTWERWQSVYPETVVLSTDTGYARNYNRDPYGEYNPVGGYYSRESTIFEPYVTPQADIHPKTVALGARSEDGAVGILKESLSEEGVMEGTVGDVPYVGVYEPTLDTGYVYRNPESVSVLYEDGEAVIDGSTYAPDTLPLERVLRYDSFWFAWEGYYPETAIFR